MRMLDTLQLDKTRISVTTLKEDDPGMDWQDQSPQARLAGLEALRQIWHDYDPSTARLPRVYTVIERTQR